MIQGLAYFLRADPNSPLPRHVRVSLTLNQVRFGGEVAVVL